MNMTVKHLTNLRAANAPFMPVDVDRPVRTVLSEWETMLNKFKNSLHDALNVRDVLPVDFVIGDLLGIYSGDGLLVFEVGMTPKTHDREFVVSYEVRPIVIHPKTLLESPLDVPGSYSELNQCLINVVQQQLMLTQNKHHWWQLHTIRAGRVTPGRNYRTSLVFRRS